MYEELKFLHVMAVILLGGTVVVDTLTGVTLPRLTSVAELRAVTGISRINQFLGWTAVVLIPIFGYATAADGELSVDEGWLLFGQVLFYIAVVISLLVLTPGALRLAGRAAALPDGPIPDDVMAEMKNPIFPALGTLLTVFFVVIVYMMVAKPNL
jgi:uncharacterized membrane protein